VNIFVAYARLFVSLFLHTQRERVVKLFYTIHAILAFNITSLDNGKMLCF